MGLSTTYGNIDGRTAWRMASAVDKVDTIEHEEGCTEPWISQIVADFVVARDAHTVLETGCFKGATSVYLYDALCRIGGGVLHLCEIELGRRAEVDNRLIHLRVTRHNGDPNVETHIWGDVRGLLTSRECPTFDLAWVDDDHTKAHVTKELKLLYPKMNPGGLILLHDVYGVCDLKTVVQQFGGYSLDLPRLGPAGGLGLIQVP